MAGWVITAQFMAAAVFLTVTLNHFLIWGRGPGSGEHLLFAATALAAACHSLTLCAVYMATTVAAITEAFRLNTLFTALWLTALTWFVAFYSRARGARRWWAVGLSVVFVCIILVDFATPGGWTFSAITGIRVTHFWGERIAFPTGVIAPWRSVNELALLGLLAFVIDGSRRLWRHERDRRRALLLGGSIALFLLAFGVRGVLLEIGLLRPPYLDAYAFLAVVLVMSHDLAGDVVRAARLSREVEASERRWRSLLENVHLVVVALDRAGAVGYVNPYAVELFGYRAAEILGRPWFDLVVPAAERAERWQQFRRFLTAKRPPHYENQIITKGGECLHMSWSRVPLRNPDGQVEGMLAVGEDVTARRRAEMEVRQQRDQLAHVNRITAMGELAASLAHELNQPLTAILSNAQSARRFMALDQPNLDEMRAILDDIIADDQRAANIIRRLRALVKKAPPKLTALQLADIVNDVVSLLRTDAVLRNIRIEVHIVPDLPLVQGDSVQLQQVLLNLLLNAFDAMRDAPPDRRLVIVRVERDAGEKVKASVIDSGTGLGDDLLEKAFQPFFTTKDNGIGMGLSICRSIINAHSGRLWAETNPAGGASFAFALPISGSQPMQQAQSG